MLCIDGHNIEMEIDIGSAVTLISNNTFSKFSSAKKLEKSKTDKDPVSLDEIGLNRCKRASVQEFEHKYSDLWKPDLVQVTGLKAKINVPESVTPKFFKPRLVSYAIRYQVNEELQMLEKEGVIEPVQFAEWAAAAVSVQKTNGQICLCRDYRLTINCGIHTVQCPFPRREDLYAKLSGGQKFTKLDLSSAFLQVPLEDDSRYYTTTNTQRGPYQYTRLPFGISSSLSVFQRIFDNMIQGLAGTVGYQDDILVTGKDDTEHMANLNAVLQRLLSSEKLENFPSFDQVIKDKDLNPLHCSPNDVSKIL
ncbi:uncharacterized protein K02A2.6-like, partial [Stylophora pistillata]|uniref:uncharacterized protein K02A2.6-like n=1 Tax=Stylophora pistillata TaxID=50429 RepID=UPI000C0478A0